jgi:protein O-mannosyl-transferase
MKRWAPFLSGAAIMLAAALVYAPALGGPFLLDDGWNIAANPSLRGFWSALNPPHSLYNLSFAFNYALGGFDPAGYHALNVLIHALSGLVLLGIVRRTLASWREDALRGPWLAPAIALVWTVHPLLTGSVAYVSERSELLMGLFYLLTLYGFVRYAENGRRRWAMVSIGACLCGVASKEVMVTAPLAVLLHDRLLGAGGFGAALRQRRRYYLGLAASWILLACLMAGPGGRRIGYGHGVSAWGYALTESRVLFRYLGLAFWPHPLVFDYDLPVAKALAPAWPWALAALALVVLVLWACVLRPPASREGRTVAFAVAFPFLALAPTSSFVPVAYQPMAENRVYLPLAALVTLALATLHRRAGRWWIPVVLALAAMLAVVTFRRSALYADPVALWTDTVSKAPQSARARSNLGTALYRAGRKSEAAAELSESVRIEPDNALLRLLLGNVLADLGRRPDAAAQYREALRLDPGLAPARERLDRLGP